VSDAHACGSGFHDCFGVLEMVGSWFRTEVIAFAVSRTIWVVIKSVMDPAEAMISIKRLREQLV
jgi:hypothetical protein